MTNLTDSQQARVDYDVALAKHRHELSHHGRFQAFDEAAARATAIGRLVHDSARQMQLDADPLNNDSYRRGAEAAQRFLAKDALTQPGTREEAAAATRQAEATAAATRAANAASASTQEALNGGGEYAAMSPEEREYRAALAQQKLAITQAWRR